MNNGRSLYRPAIWRGAARQGGRWWRRSGTVMALAVAGVVRGDTGALTLSCGYLCGPEGISMGNRMPPDTLCVLVADLAGDGFAPPRNGWVSDDDVLVRVSDTEYPAGQGGTLGFDLAPGTTEPGLLSRQVLVDPAQFGSRTAPVRVALRWFPGLRASQVDPAVQAPPAGTVYGEFTRTVPRYPEHGTAAWEIPAGPGGWSVTLDPLAVPALGGTDDPVRGRASRVLGGEGLPPSGLGLGWGAPGRAAVSFWGTPGMVYRVERSQDLTAWPQQWTVDVGADGVGTVEDTAAPEGRAFYRVSGPLTP